MRPSAARLGILFEGSLALVAVLVGAAVGHPPWLRLRLADAVEGGPLLLLGALAALPMLCAFALLPRLPWPDLQHAAEDVERLVRRLFSGAGRGALVGLSAAAGLGEELLFRGLVQDGLASWLGAPHGAWIGLIVGSAAFGLAHPISVSYALVVGLNGAYLGCLVIATGSLWPAVVAHAVYDLVALAVILRSRRPPGSAEDNAADIPVASEQGS
jgi:membrane protease YdiL (CAAX protease family)